MSLVTEPSVTWATGKYSGLPGSITRYYWIQAIYPSGRSVLSNVIIINNGGSLGQGNSISLQWAGAPGAIGYDVIQTPDGTEPAVNSTATIAVAQGLTGNSLNLTIEPVLNSWTYYQGNGSYVPPPLQVSFVAISGSTDQKTGVIFLAAGVSLTIPQPIPVTDDGITLKLVFQGNCYFNSTDQIGDGVTVMNLLFVSTGAVSVQTNSALDGIDGTQGGWVTLVAANGFWYPIDSMYAEWD